MWELQAYSNHARVIMFRHFDWCCFAFASKTRLLIKWCRSVHHARLFFKRSEKELYRWQLGMSQSTKTIGRFLDTTVPPDCRDFWWKKCYRDCDTDLSFLRWYPETDRRDGSGGEAVATIPLFKHHRTSPSKRDDCKKIVFTFTDPYVP